MMEVQGARMLAQLLGPGAAQPSPPASASADESQAARFRALLQTGEPADVAAASPEAAASLASGATDAVASARPPASIGDSILQGLEKVRGSLSEGWASTQSLIDPQVGPMSTGRLLQFQVNMLNMGFQYQVVTGVATKTAQNIDQLVKMQ